MGLFDRINAVAMAEIKRHPRLQKKRTKPSPSKESDKAASEPAPKRIRVLPKDVVQGVPLSFSLPLMRHDLGFVFADSEAGATEATQNEAWLVLYNRVPHDDSDVLADMGNTDRATATRKYVAGLVQVVEQPEVDDIRHFYHSVEKLEGILRDRPKSLRRLRGRALVQLSTRVPQNASIPRAVMLLRAADLITSRAFAASRTVAEAETMETLFAKAQHRGAELVVFAVLDTSCNGTSTSFRRVLQELNTLRRAQRTRVLAECRQRLQALQSDTPNKIVGQEHLLTERQWRRVDAAIGDACVKQVEHLRLAPLQKMQRKTKKAASPQVEITDDADSNSDECDSDSDDELHGIEKVIQSLQQFILQLQLWRQLYGGLLSENTYRKVHKQIDRVLARLGDSEAQERMSEVRADARARWRDRQLLQRHRLHEETMKQKRAEFRAYRKKYYLEKNKQDFEQRQQQGRAAAEAAKRAEEERIRKEEERRQRIAAEQERLREMMREQQRLREEQERRRREQQQQQHQQQHQRQQQRSNEQFRAQNDDFWRRFCENAQRSHAASSYKPQDWDAVCAKNFREQELHWKELEARQEKGLTITRNHVEEALPQAMRNGPLDSHVSMLCLPYNAPLQERKRRFRVLIMRCHPDRFMSRFGPLVDDLDRGEVATMITFTSQALNAEKPT